ncbi:MAG: glycosyl transferase group 1, partial [Phycisphaerales bacterium]|nr:glycosyl transferase group 1 [Phycisphaerales bacterium]
MRLTIINQFYTPDISPTAHLCASLAEHRAARGDEVTVITSRSGYVGGIGALRASGGAVRVCRVWSSRLGSRTNLRRFLDWATFYLPAAVRALTLPKQDVIIALTTPPFITLAGVAHKVLHPSTKLVLWNMDCYP